MAGRLDIADVTTAYDKANVLEGVSLKIEPGHTTCLLGSNGHAPHASDSWTTIDPAVSTHGQC